jgi:hypothetical protein
MKHRNMILVAIGVFISVSVQAKPVIPHTHKDSVYILKQIILESNTVMGSSVGFAGSPSNTWYAFAWLINIATPQELLGMATHKNAVLRLYAYTGLLYRRYKPAATIIEKFSNDTTTVRTLSGCIMNNTTVAEALNNTGVWYDKTSVQELWKAIQTDARYRKEIFTALKDNKPVKRYDVDK